VLEQRVVLVPDDGEVERHLVRLLNVTSSCGIRVLP
jgi:hypothetical protein